MKFLWLLVLAVIAWRLIVGRWPWHSATAAKRKRALAEARLMLGVSARAEREEIIDAHRRLVARVHPDRGGSNEQVHAANDARDLLLAECNRSPQVHG